MDSLSKEKRRKTKSFEKNKKENKKCNKCTKKLYLKCGK